MGCCIAGVLLASQGLTAFARVRAFLQAWIGFPQFRISRRSIAAMIGVEALFFGALFIYETDLARAHLDHAAEIAKSLYAIGYDPGAEFPVCRGTAMLN